MKDYELRDLEIFNNPEDYRSFYLETPAKYIERMLARTALDINNVLIDELPN